MNTQTSQRLDEVLPLITDADFLAGRGIGNEIAFHIFDYPAQDELVVRQHVEWLTTRIPKDNPQLRVLSLNLLDVVIEYLKDRGLYDKALNMSATKSDSDVLKALSGPLSANRVRDFIADRYRPQDWDLVLMSGVGSVWPLLRAHSLLSNLHAIMGSVPLIMFYPGSFDGATLSLFGEIAPASTSPDGKPYYRAFNLVPRKAKK